MVTVSAARAPVVPAVFGEAPAAETPIAIEAARATRMSATCL